MVTLLSMVMMSALSSAVVDDELSAQPHISTVQPGIIGGCVGSGIGCCVGVGPVGAIVGYLAGSYIENMSKEPDKATKAKEEKTEAAYEKARQTCEEKKASLGADKDRMSCPPEHGFPWLGAGLAGLGGAATALITVVAVVVGIGALSGGVLLGVSAGVPALAGVGVAGAGVIVVLGLVLANAVGIALFAPLLWHYMRVWWN